MVATTLDGVMLTGNHAGRPAASAVAKGTLYSCTTHSLVYQSDASSWSTWATLGSAASGSITSSGYTQSTARLLGRTTASTGAIEEISVGSGLSLSGGSLSASGGSFTPVVASYTRTSGAYTPGVGDTWVNLDNTNLNFSLTTGAHRVLVAWTGSAESDTVGDRCFFDVEVARW